MTDQSTPLIVDLDGTLLNTDMMVESLLAVLKKNLLLIFVMPVWLLQGRARFKRELAARVQVDAVTLPYNSEVLERLQLEKSAGRTLILATGSDSALAQPIAEHLQIFDRVMASDGLCNLTREHKRTALVTEYGEGGYDYLGNSSADIPVWASARHSLVVAAPGTLQRLSRHTRFDEVFSLPAAGFKVWLRALRVHQWLKNLLLFIPLILAHNQGAAELLPLVVFAFLTFSLCSSAVYVINDLMDLPNDRRHPSKCRRPFASGALSVFSGLFLAPSLLLIVVLMLSQQPVAFIQVTALYFILTCGYSLVLKRIVIVDVLTLAMLYTLRIIAGGAVVGLVVSFWLLAFSMFIFMSLALLKRYAELLEVPEDGGAIAVSGRGYSTRDAGFLSTLGAASGYSSVVVMALYINSDVVMQMYSAREVLWFVCPVLLFWISHMWFSAHRGRMHEDPIVFAVKDAVSLLSAGALALLFYLAV
ncbi:MAG: 4-hydroxybenzoate polyprenyltransferase/phosphoserine phosphatase [Halieaceae bacterium]|jgi:4-hydroxybenzoate polyprenyltransferase/phosphoserine phosphatase